MAGPKNASINAGGFRVYSWNEPGKTPVDVLSVTSIRKLCGEPFTLSNWKVSNVVNVAMGQRKSTQRGPKGGEPKGYVPDGPFPGPFVAKLLESEGVADEVLRVRKWLMQMADEPRDVAAARGTTVHESIELGIPAARIDLKYVQDAFSRNRSTSPVTGADVDFVRQCLRQYEDLRSKVPFVVIAREPQVWNLSAGYAGSLDVILWVLPPDVTGTLESWQTEADEGRVTAETIDKVGGRLVLGDWKTSQDVYTDHIVQGHAYIAGEFIGRDGVKDERLTAILHKIRHGALIHIRPTSWAVDYFDFRQDVLYAFLGSVAFARFLATYQRPAELFSETIDGAADTEGGPE